MKKLLIFLLVTLSFSYDIKEFTTCKNVQNLTPFNPTTTFSIKDKKVYAFAYFTNIKQNRLIDFVWEKEVNGIWKLYADIKLPIFSGNRWRTYSNITIRPYFKGKWRVSLFEGNKTIRVLDFYIKRD
ncbi:MAG: DUF2914 domain-containing protein [Nautiliaceae bacterium]|jgi:hypothetical protein